MSSAQGNNDTRTLSTKRFVYISLDLFYFVNITSSCSFKRKERKERERIQLNKGSLCRVQLRFDRI